MARPPTGRRGKNVTLYLETDTYEAARKHAFRHKVSLSDLVNRLLVAELASPGGLALRHPRSPGGPR